MALNDVAMEGSRLVARARPLEGVDTRRMMCGRFHPVIQAWETTIDERLTAEHLMCRCPDIGHVFSPGIGREHLPGCRALSRAMGLMQRSLAMVKPANPEQRRIGCGDRPRHDMQAEEGGGE
jgi:hypothetical protein